MTRCSSCRGEIGPAGRRAGSCPWCAAPLAPEPDQAPVVVARLANLAEAGYFQDLLASEGMAAQVVDQSSRDVHSGRSLGRVVLVVPPDAAERACALIEAELRRTAADPGPEPAEAGLDGAAGIGAIGPGTVLLIALVLIGLGGVAQLAHPGPPRHPRAASRSSEFWDTLRHTPGVWVQRTAAGTVRRMWYTPSSNTITIVEGRDRLDPPSAWQQFRNGRLIRSGPQGVGDVPPEPPS